MPPGVSLFVWLPEERAKWVEMRAKRDRSIRAMVGQYAPISIKPRPRGDNRRHRQQTVAVSHWARIGHKICRASLDMAPELHEYRCAILGLNQTAHYYRYPLARLDLQLSPKAPQDRACH
jgi:hypothetical protein